MCRFPEMFLVEAVDGGPKSFHTLYIEKIVFMFNKIFVRIGRFRDKFDIIDSPLKKLKVLFNINFQTSYLYYGPCLIKIAWWSKN